jgi:hypothetical protein
MMNLLAKAEENQWIGSHLGEMQCGAIMTSGSVFVAPFGLKPSAADQ